MEDIVKEENSAQKVELTSNYGKWLRAYRTEKKISLIELSKICKVDISNLSKIENGIRDTNVNTLLKICKALNVRVEIGEA